MIKHVQVDAAVDGGIEKQPQVMMMGEAKKAKLEVAQKLVLKIKDVCKAPFIARDAVQELTGGLINPRTLSNHDSAGTGPQGMFYVGRRAVYPADAFCDWLVSRVRLEPEMAGRGGARR